MWTVLPRNAAALGPHARVRAGRSRAGAPAGRGHADLRHATIRRPRQADLHEPAVEPAREQRGAAHQRDRPGRHAVRRVRPSVIEHSHYNCHETDDIAPRTGFTKLGIEKVGTPDDARVLIDVAALKGTDMLGDAYEITGQDLQQALQRQNVSVQPGDAVIIHTGWARLWDKDNARYMKSNAEALRDAGCPLCPSELVASHTLLTTL
jgi:hypothetical protein